MMNGKQIALQNEVYHRMGLSVTEEQANRERDVALRSGMCYEGLMDLTGAPTLYRRFDDDDVPFDDLKRYDESSYVICASTPGVDTLSEGGATNPDEGGRPT